MCLLHLGLDEGDDCRVVIRDAYDYAIKASEGGEDGKYDAIFVDVFDDSNVVPEVFTSCNFAVAVKSMLGVGGVAAINLHTGNDLEDELFRDCVKSWEGAFGFEGCQVGGVRFQNNKVLVGARDGKFNWRRDDAKVEAEGMGWGFDPSKYCKPRRRPI